MREFIIAVLDDENGINQAAYDELRALADIAGDYGTNLDDILSCVRAQDGRYFLPEEHGLK